MLIGRNKEQEQLLAALESPDAEMIALIGRRRVGKTFLFLVNETYHTCIAFEITGVQHASREEQLLNFHWQVQRYAPTSILGPPPED